MNIKNLEKIESQTFRRLISHLQSRTEVQNIDIMNLTGFCRNCLYKWMHEAARDRMRPYQSRRLKSMFMVCLMMTGKKSSRSDLTYQI